MCSTFCQCGIDVNYYEPFTIDAVVANVPSWIFRERQDCSDRLMSLSMTQLQPVLQLLQISNCRRKCDVGVIVDVFLGKRLEFCNSLTRRDQPWTFAVAKTKWSRGPACARRYDFDSGGLPV